VAESGNEALYGEFEFDRRRLCSYWMAGTWILFGIVGLVGAVPTFGISILLVPAAAILTRLWIGLVFRRLRYDVDEDSVNIRSGVLFHVEKVIPLEKITDIKLVQGPLMRLFSCYNVLIQTAGSGHQVPEGIMTFESHEKAVEVRERIMTARQRFRSGLLGVGTGDD
jgi:membrane protein YdbS with pleckstrin-like domain